MYFFQRNSITHLWFLYNFMPETILLECRSAAIWNKAETKEWLLTWRINLYCHSNNFCIWRLGPIKSSRNSLEVSKSYLFGVGFHSLVSCNHCRVIFRFWFWPIVCFVANSSANSGCHNQTLISLPCDVLKSYDNWDVTVFNTNESARFSTHKVCQHYIIIIISSVAVLACRRYLEWYKNNDIEKKAMEKLMIRLRSKT